MNEALWLIRDWAHAYPVSVFSHVSPEEVRKAAMAMQSVGVSSDAMHASWARAILDDIQKIADEGVGVREPEDA